MSGDAMTQPLSGGASGSAVPEPHGHRARLSRRLWTILGSVCALLAVAAAAFWAGRVVALDSPTDTAQSEQPVTVTVSEQEVGRSFALNATVTQDRVPLASNLLAGVLTGVSDASEFTQGQTLYSVADVPVRAVAGSTPFYRPLSRGDQGADVQQLNQALSDLGYLWGVDDVFDVWTENAVKLWQTDLDQETTGQVALGELVAVDQLPASLFLDPEVARPGSVLQGSEVIVSRAAGSPSFVLELNDAQAQGIPSTASVDITHDDHTWPAVIAETTRDEDQGTTNLVLTAPDGGVVCAEECSSLPSSEKFYLPARVEVVAPERGPAVPVAALRTGADGTVSVIVVEADGTAEERAVSVRASMDGTAIVDGVTVGEVVQVLGGEALPDTTQTQPVSPAQSGTQTQSGTTDGSTQSGH